MLWRGDSTAAYLRRLHSNPLSSRGGKHFAEISSPQACLDTCKKSAIVLGNQVPKPQRSTALVPSYSLVPKSCVWSIPPLDVRILHRSKESNYPLNTSVPHLVSTPATCQSAQMILHGKTISLLSAPTGPLCVRERKTAALTPGSNVSPTRLSINGISKTPRS